MLTSHFPKGGSVKRKNDPKSDLKSIDPKVLDKVLGGVQPWDTDRKGAVIPQPPFGSHFHS